MSGPSPVFFTTSILPVRRGLVLKGGGPKRVPLRVRVGYFHHPQLGHTLIDTGYSRHVVDAPNHGPFLGLYRRLLRPSVVDDAPLVKGLARLGLEIPDIETVVITHMHADHIGGLMDVPDTRVLVPKRAWESMTRHSKVSNALEGVFPSLLPHDIETRLTFLEDVGGPADLNGDFDLTRDGAVRVVQLPGHLEGQIGLLFPQTTPPLLYAADAQWSLDAVRDNRLPGFPANRIYHDRDAAMQSVEKVRGFLSDGCDVVLCHDWSLNTRDIDPDIPGDTTSHD